jgi:thiamine kinase-like enzyme
VENMMLCTKADTGSPDLKIIDWEIADIGDEAWDAGAVIQAYLSFWVFSLPLNSGMSLTDAAASSPYSGDEIKSALAAYWSSYARTRGFTQPAARQMLNRAWPARPRE